MIKWADNNGLKLIAKKTQLLLLRRNRKKTEQAQVLKGIDGRRGGREEQICEVPRSDAG